MRKIILIVCLILILTSTVNAQWRLDGLNVATVRNFRITSSTISASAQPSVIGFSLLKDVLKRETIPSTQIYIVDLRQESHGFANGIPVSWYEEHNQANFGKSANEIQVDEIEKLKSILGKQIEFVPLGKNDEATLNKLAVVIESIQNEKAVAEAEGFKYVRFSATDMVFPDDEVVDEFIKFYFNLPKNHWLHFHCQAGHGRTTTFAVFYDILTHSDLTLEEIVNKHHSLGGSNLLAESSGNDWYANASNERRLKTIKFYEYVKENRKSKFKITWSQWLKNKNK